MTTIVAPAARRDASPRIGPDRRRTWIAVPVFALLAAAAAGVVAAGKIPRGRRQAELAKVAEATRALIETPRVKVVRSLRGAKPLSLKLPADLIPLLESPLHARSGGYLKKVLVDIGDRVEAGQLLAQIEAPEMAQELDRARATVVQALAEVDLAKARRELAALSLRRTEALHRRSASTDEEVDENRAGLLVAAATVSSAEATLAARRAEVRRLEATYSFLRITAPFRGTITARGFDPGALIAGEGSGQKPLFRIAQDETLKVVFSVPQSHLASIREGQMVRLLVPELAGREFIGKVSRTARAVDAASRTLRVEVDLPNADHVLFSGMFVEAELTRAVATPLTVPANAVLNGPEGSRVAVVGPEGRVRIQPIEIRRDLGARLEVSAGLEGDELLIENPGPGLADGARVEVVTLKEPGDPKSSKSRSRVGESKAMGARDADREADLKAIQGARLQPTEEPGVFRDVRLGLADHGLAGELARPFDQRIVELIGVLEAEHPPGEQAELEERFEVLGDVRQSPARSLDDLGDALLPVHEASDDSQTRRVGERAESGSDEVEILVGGVGGHGLTNQLVANIVNESNSGVLPRKSTRTRSRSGEIPPLDWLVPVAMMAIWFVLSRWILPYAGFPTCPSGTCSTSSPAAAVPGESGSRPRALETKEMRDR